MASLAAVTKPWTPLKCCDMNGCQFFIVLFGCWFLLLYVVTSPELFSFLYCVLFSLDLLFCYVVLLIFAFALCCFSFAVFFAFVGFVDSTGASPPRARWENWESLSSTKWGNGVGRLQRGGRIRILYLELVSCLSSSLLFSLSFFL